MPRALAASAAPECSGSHNAVPHARGITAIAVGARLQAESAIKAVAANVIPALLVNHFLAVLIMCNCSCRLSGRPSWMHGRGPPPERIMVHRGAPICDGVRSGSGTSLTAAQALLTLVHMTHCASSWGGHMVLLPGPGKKLAPPRNRFLLCDFFVAGERPSPDARLCRPFGRLV
jgi:hypothetical protein